jgi:hypothetical protein
MPGSGWRDARPALGRVGPVRKAFATAAEVAHWSHIPTGATRAKGDLAASQTAILRARDCLGFALRNHDIPALI